MAIPAEKLTNTHTCHWPGCDKPVHPIYWGCYRHWMKLPRRLRQRIFQHYRAGQEVDKRPSREYLEVAEEVRQWCLEHPEVK